ncbi:hypothetical protein [Bosea psychrotolerans]|uniref:Dolichyl-phosphate-mannose-protein mannosyltransferase n=1 Tax=Bosea psychrotolerans TaxID=1871628 RepID=A0A2S4M803_9HYPH|nr:hypothetical protein [Bosea psychrotolerans]POR50873.1 hypothetical protein CYD53_108121 [Bosea psychrotolerans]
MTDEKAAMVRATRLDERRGTSTLSTTLIAAFALAAVVALILPLNLPIGPYNWDTLVYYDAINRIRAGQMPNVDFFAPVGPLGYYLATVLDSVFPRAQPMLLVNWALLPVLLPSMAMLTGHVAAYSRGQALALLLPFLLFASLPINLQAIYPISGFDGYGHYNRHVALLLYTLVATLIFSRDRRLLVGLVALLMLTLFLVKITGAVSGALLVGYAVLVGRLRVIDAVLAAALVLVPLGALDLATGMVGAYVDDILTLLRLNGGSLLSRFLTVASLNLDVIAPCVLLLGTLALAGWRERADLSWVRMRSLGASPPGWLAAVLIAEILFETQNTGSLEFIGLWPVILLVLVDWQARRDWLGLLVLVLCLAVVLPALSAFTQRSARAVFAAPFYHTLDLAELGTLGHVNVKAEIAERAPIMLEHYATYQASYRDLVTRGQMPSYILFSETDYQATWLLELQQGLVAIRAWEATAGRRLNGVFTLDFVDPFNRLLGREPARHVPIGVDPARTNPPVTEQTLSALEGIDAILQPKCPLTVNRNTIATHFARALQGRRRVALSSCWDMYLKD